LSESTQAALFSAQSEPVILSPKEAPILLVTVDAEAEFDWNAPKRRDALSVGSILNQGPAQEIFGDYGITPSYLVDFAVVSDDAACAALSAYLQGEICEIGAHLNPWITPPLIDDLTRANTFPGNLDAELERAKLTRLTEEIESRFGAQPRVFRAGRYGIGRNSAAILADLGYRVDLSLAPRENFSPEGGPDFSDLGPEPFWFGAGPRLLEIPMTWDFCGPLFHLGLGLAPVLTGPVARSIRLPAVLARLGLLEYIRLTPEGDAPSAHQRLTEALLARGQRVFSFGYHSTSLVPGNTPYVRTERDLSEFLDRLRRYFDYFFGTLNGVAMTPMKLHEKLASGMSVVQQR
jgi:hypothetical protein